MEVTDNVHWRYERNGSGMSNSMGRKRTGKRRVEKDQLCIEFEQEMPNCYEVLVVGEKSQAATRGSPADGSGHRTAIRSHMNSSQLQRCCGEPILTRDSHDLRNDRNLRIQHQPRRREPMQRISALLVLCLSTADMTTPAAGPYSLQHTIP